MFSKLTILFALVAFIASVNGANSKKPSKAPVVKVVTTKKPTVAPTSRNRIVNTANIPLPYNAYAAIAGQNGTNKLI